jgi:hypothetical protein
LIVPVLALGAVEAITVVQAPHVLLLDLVAELVEHAHAVEIEGGADLLHEAGPVVVVANAGHGEVVAAALLLVAAVDLHVVMHVF